MVMPAEPKKNNIKDRQWNYNNLYMDLCAPRLLPLDNGVAPYFQCSRVADRRGHYTSDG